VSEKALTDSEEKGPRPSGDERRGLFSRFTRFWRQVIQELKLVVTPSREETIKYIWIVLGFVAVVMVLVFVMDSVFKFLATKVFGG